METNFPIATSEQKSKQRSNWIVKSAVVAGIGIAALTTGAAVMAVRNTSRVNTTAE